MSRLTQRVMRIGGLVFGVLVLAACGTTPAPSAGLNPSSTPDRAPLASPSAAQARADREEATFDDARSVALAAAADSSVYAVLGVKETLLVARDAADGAGFAEPVRATADIPALVNPVERPSIAVDGRGRVVVAWLDPRATGKTVVWHARSEDGARTFGAPVEIARADAGTGIMVSTALDSEGGPQVAWLQGAALALARSTDAGASFEAAQVVEDEVCDCCQPAPLVLGERLLIAFRNVMPDGEDDLRDIYVLGSDDGGRTFSSPTMVSDGSWRINACPVSGPALAADGERVYAAWMDGRADRAGDSTRGDVWLASSTDQGRTFGPNVRVNAAAEHLHTLPALAVGPDGRLHLSWELIDGQRKAILYTTSADQGATFAPPTAIADSAGRTGGGRPGAPSLAVTSAGRVYLAWTDRLGAHVLSWSGESAPPATSR